MRKGELIPANSGEEQAALARFAASRSGSIFHDLNARFSDLNTGNAFTTDDPKYIEIRHGNSVHDESMTVLLSELEKAMPEFAARARMVMMQ